MRRSSRVSLRSHGNYVCVCVGAGVCVCVCVCCTVQIRFEISQQTSRYETLIQYSKKKGKFVKYRCFVLKTNDTYSKFCFYFKRCLFLVQPLLPSTSSTFSPRKNSFFSKTKLCAMYDTKAQ